MQVETSLCDLSASVVDDTFNGSEKLFPTCFLSQSRQWSVVTEAGVTERLDFVAKAVSQ